MSFDETTITEKQMADLMEAARLIALSNTTGLDQADQQALQEWVEKDARHAGWLVLLQDERYLEVLHKQYAQSQQIASQELDTFFKNHNSDITIEPARRIPLYRRWWAAASIVFVVGIGSYIWVTNNVNSDRNSIAQPIAAIAPGREGATLTLSDGREVVLDSLANGVIANQNGSNLVLNNGLLSYDLIRQSTEEVMYNTMTTPKGRQFAVTLPDGTRVWLNAASSIRYPTVFNAKERIVMVTGEVYFEVASDRSKPFLVKANDMEVQVLGTSFNINAYNDEPAVKTTLLDGSIKVFKLTQPTSGIILKPGEQVIVNESIAINRTVDLEQTIAWKNGIFNFDGATLEEFMRQISRWYDLNIIYAGEIPHRIFKGKMGRDLQLSQIMELLTQFKIKYKCEGNTITIESQ